MLGKLPVPGRPAVLIKVGQGPTALAVGAGGGCLDIFTLIYPFSSFSPSLWETARYRLKYCLKGPLNPKQTTNQQPDLLLREFCKIHKIYIGTPPSTPDQKNFFFLQIQILCQISLIRELKIGAVEFVL